MYEIKKNIYISIRRLLSRRVGFLHAVLFVFFSGGGAVSEFNCRVIAPALAALVGVIARIQNFHLLSRRQNLSEIFH